MHEPGRSTALLTKFNASQKSIDFSTVNLSVGSTAVSLDTLKNLKSLAGIEALMPGQASNNADQWVFYHSPPGTNIRWKKFLHATTATAAEEFESAFCNMEKNAPRPLRVCVVGIAAAAAAAAATPAIPANATGATATATGAGTATGGESAAAAILGEHDSSSTDPAVNGGPSKRPRRGARLSKN